jgi:hypothetical protein
MVLRQKLLLGLHAIATSATAATTAAIATSATAATVTAVAEVPGPAEAGRTVVGGAALVDGRASGTVAKGGEDRTVAESGERGPGGTCPLTAPTRLLPSAAAAAAAAAATATAPRFAPLALDFAEFDELTARGLRGRVAGWGRAPLLTDVAAARPVVRATAPTLKPHFQTTGRAWPECGGEDCLPIPERDRRTPDCQITRQGGISCCATGHLEGVKMLVDAGWDSVRLEPSRILIARVLAMCARLRVLTRRARAKCGTDTLAVAIYSCCAS